MVENENFWDESENLFDKVDEGIIKDSKKPEKDTEVSLEDDLFAKVDNDNIIVNSNQELEDNSKKTTDTFSSLAKFGGYTEEDLEGITSEEDLIETIVKDRLSEKLDELPKDAQYAIRHILEGGDLISAIKEIGSGMKSGISDNEDLSSEENAERVLRELLHSEGLDGEAINVQIDLLKQSDNLLRFAKSKYEPYKNSIANKKEEIRKKQILQKEQEQKEQESIKKEFESLIKDDIMIGDVLLPKKHKKDIPNYITEKSVKNSQGAYMTEFQKDLFYDLPKNKKAMVQLASLMKNRNSDGTFNLNFLKEKVESSVTSKINKNLQNNTDKPFSVTEVSGKYLADLFN